MTPVRLADRYAWYAKSWLIWVLLVAALAAAAIAGQLTRDYVQRRQAEAFAELSKDLATRIAERVHNYEQVLRGANGLIVSSATVDRIEWRRYVAALALEKNFPGTQALGYSLLVSPADRAAHEAAVRAEGFSDYAIHPAGERERYSTTVFIEPFGGSNMRAFGFDMLSEPTRRAAMDAARDSGAAVLSGRVTLVMDSAESPQPGFLLYMPVYRKGEKLDTLEQRRAALQAYAFAAFRAGDLLQGILGRDGPPIEYAIYDGAMAESPQLLHQTSGWQEGDAPSLDLGRATIPLEVAGRQWTIVAMAGSVFARAYASHLPDVILFGGGLLAVSLWSAVYLLMRQRARAYAMARAMTNEMRESEEKFRLVVEGSPDGMVMVDASGYIVLANHQAHSMFGYVEGPSGLAGRTIEDLVPSSVRSVHAQQRMAYMTAPITRAMGQGRHLTALRCDGTTFDVEIGLRSLQLPDGRMVLAVIQDISERLRAESDASATRALLQGVINAATEFSIIATDVDGLITLFSSGAERLLGYSADEMVGKRTPEIIHLRQEIEARAEAIRAQTGERVAGFEVFVHRARGGEPESLEWTYVRKDGSHLQVQLVVTAIRDAQGQVSGFIGVGYDVTERNRTLRALSDARDAAVSANQAKSDFLATISHEIRTPLNAVLGIVQLLGFTQLDMLQKGYLKLVENSGRALLGIINDVLDFAKIEAGRLDIAARPFRLRELVDGLMAMMSVKAAERQLGLFAEISSALPAMVVGDAMRIQQVLMNLTGNAIKFTPQGKVSLDLKFVERSGGMVRVRFEVTDTGIGLDECEIARLFAPFSQIDSSSTRTQGGTGLGLAISKRIVEKMGGEIGVVSQPGKGSTFWFELPLEEGEDEQLSGDTAVKRRVIVIDRDPASRTAIAVAALGLGWKQVTPVREADLHALVENGPGQDVSVDVLVVGRSVDSDTAQYLRNVLTSPRRPRQVIVAAALCNVLEAMQDNGVTLFDAFVSEPVNSSTLLDAVVDAESKYSWSAAIGDGSSEVPEVSAQVLEGKRLLLVEDNHVNQLVARGILNFAGAKVDLAGNGFEAVERLRDPANEYDAVLMDIQMPVMDGLEATRILRRELKLELPIIALTAGVFDLQREQCLEVGMNEFIPKPIDAGHMLRIVADQLGIKRKMPVRNGPHGIDADLPEVAGLDTRGVSSRLGVGPGLFREMLRQFVKEAEVFPFEAKSALAQGRVADLRRLFHTLKSSSANVGANKLSAFCAELERKLTDGAVPDNAADVDEALKRLAEVRTQIAEHLDESAPPRNGAVVAPEPVVAPAPEAVEALIELLKRHDLAALDAFARLQAGLGTILGKDVVQGLAERIDRLDFDAATKLLSDSVDS